MIRFVTDVTFCPYELKDTASFEKDVRNACYSLIQKESWGDRCNFLNYIKYDFRKPKVEYYAEYGLLMHYSYLYAISCNDQSMKKLIEEKFSKLLLHNQSWQIERIDQSTYGLVALDIYENTGKVEYKQFADKLYRYLDSLFFMVIYIMGKRKILNKEWMASVSYVLSYINMEKQRMPFQTMPQTLQICYC